MAQVVLQRLGVSGLAESLDSVGVAEQVRVDAFPQASFLGCSGDDLISAEALDGKEAVGTLQAMAEGISLETLGQGYGAGYPAGFAALANEPEGGASVKDFHVGRCQAQGLRDAEPCLEHHPDEESVAVSGAWALQRRVLKPAHFVRGEVGDYGCRPGDSHPANNN